MADKELSSMEHLKARSRYLRGDLAEDMADPHTGGVSEDSAQLLKFHGMYLQDDRDLRPERTKKKLEKAFGFMIRLRLPGGVVTPRQWLALDEIARIYAGETLRLTTRQTFQLHGVLKFNVKTALKKINAVALDTIAACGDDTRGVMAVSNPHQSKIHAEAYDLACRISLHFKPKTRAYYEIFLDGEKVVGEGERDDVETIYGKTYMPRKFKIGFAVPPSNDIDVFAQDLGFIAIVGKDDTIEGWNVAVGGGMGMTHGEPETYPRIADVLGFCRPEDLFAVAEAVLTIQRDWGDRTNRKHARLKYTLDDRGADAFLAEIAKRARKPLEKARPYAFTSNGDRYGWTEGENGKHHLTLFVENGRLSDLADGRKLLTGMRRIANVHDGEIRVTPNQNLIIANVAKDKRKEIEDLVAEHRMTGRSTALRRNSMACVALPTCGLALAESERYLSGLIDALDERLAAHGLSDDDIVIRMTGCPNGCARPYIAEIGLVGKGPGRYNLYLGAAFDGSRMNKLFVEDLDHDGIIAALDPIFAAYAAGRQKGERFGDFTIRAGYVAATSNGLDFHANVRGQTGAATAR
ncbi:MAG TPA: NADPH-dependent assimilatory sulfite reductase hemoprotein subunit [Pseudolabrys sp.]